MKRTFLILWAAALFCGTARGDVFHLKGGSTIEGEVLQHKGDVIVVIVGSGEISIPAAMVERRERAPSPTEQYSRRLAALEPTAAAHADLGRWCAGKQLNEQAREHFLQALKLDENNETARRALGYVRYDNRWTTRDEIREAKDAEPPDPAARDHEYRFRSKQWTERLRELGGGPLNQWQFSDAFTEGRNEVLAISDPAAVQPLRDVLARHPEEPVRLLAVEALGRIGGDDAALALVDIMTSDADSEVWHRSREVLAEMDSKKAGQELTNLMRKGGEVARDRVAGAVADAGLMNSVPGLIRSLITREVRVIVHETVESQRAWIAIGTRYGYVADLEPVVAEGAVAFNPVIGYITQGAVLDVHARVEPWAERIIITVTHPEVLEALKRITGADFGYDVRAWRRWYGQYLVQQQNQPSDATPAAPASSDQPQNESPQPQTPAAQPETPAAEPLP
ncbi:MAG: HEAT repeat domain-containing protein [Planctomycetes bacterium]|nr:HEAT repeat domain-containing protein [Planctomycetota bacterium]